VVAVVVAVVVAFIEVATVIIGSVALIEAVAVTIGSAILLVDGNPLYRQIKLAAPPPAFARANTLGNVRVRTESYSRRACSRQSAPSCPIYADGDRRIS
jgi:hypothetical protein